MSDQLWELLRETHEMQLMIEKLRNSDAAGTTTPEQQRAYRLRRAALAQRHLAAAETTGSDPEEAAEDAEQTAALLWKHDVLHGSHQGPLSANSPVWEVSGLHEYVRQEATAAGLPNH